MPKRKRALRRGEIIGQRVDREVTDDPDFIAFVMKASNARVEVEARGRGARGRCAHEYGPLLGAPHTRQTSRRFSRRTAAAG
jgi:hypothetical protein